MNEKGASEDTETKKLPVKRRKIDKERPKLVTDVIREVMSFCDTATLVWFSELSRDFRRFSYLLVQERYERIDQIYSTTFQFPCGCHWKSLFFRTLALERSMDVDTYYACY